MGDWNKFNAVVWEKSKKKTHRPPMFPVIVWAVSIDTAREKLATEYPSQRYEIISLDAAVENK